MAEISQIKLPNASLYDIKDTYARTLVNQRAINLSLTNTDLNTVKTPGFYNASGGSNNTNIPSAVGEGGFGLEVIHTAGGEYYTQFCYYNTENVNNCYKRICSNGVGSDGAIVKITDTNTDVSVSQGITTTSNGHSLILGLSYFDSGTADITSETGMVYKAKNVAVQPSTGTIRSSRLILGSTNDVALTSNNTPALTIGGDTTAAHLQIDVNKIMAKANETTGAALYLNDGAGGSVYIGQGGLVLPTNLYQYNSKFGINMRNSDIIGANSIYFGDLSGNASEGIHFYRDGTNGATLGGNTNSLYYTKNHAAGSSGTNYRVVTATVSTSAAPSTGEAYMFYVQLL